MIPVAAADTLWAAVKTRYAAGILISLTNPGSGATTIDDTRGTNAATAVIALWPAHAQVDFDVDDATHLEVGVRGVVAQLREWGGTSSGAAEADWEEVFGNGGLIEKVRNTGPRAHAGPVSNSGVQPAPETQGGRRVRPWSGRESLPDGILPNRRTADY